jgi:beta-galactosidase
MDARNYSAKPNIFDFTPTYGQAYHESYYRQIMDRPYIAGAAIWNMVDFGSEDRRETMPHVNNKGMVTMDRKPKDIYWFYQAAFLKNTSILKIAETERPFRKLYINRNETTSESLVKLYGNVPNAEVYLNKVLIDKVRFEQYTASLDLPFKEGKNVIEVIYNNPKTKSAVSDLLTIDVQFQSLDLTDKPIDEITINCGSHVEYTDPATKQVWEADRPYQKGSYGYIGGRPLIIIGRIGIQDEVVGSDMQAVYQTRRDSLEGYQFDVLPGTYEVELLWAEYDLETQRIVYDLANDPVFKNNNAKERTLSAWVNGFPVVQELNLFQDYGFNRAVSKKAVVTVFDKQGLNIKLKAVKGMTTLSGIRVKRL